MKKLIDFFRDEEGATAVEYGLMLALIAAVIIGAVTFIGKETNNSFSNMASAMDAAVS